MRISAVVLLHCPEPGLLSVVVITLHKHGNSLPAHLESLLLYSSCTLLSMQYSMLFRTFCTVRSTLIA